ncbi:MAG: hypothetical protein ACI8P3_003257 [Saprospiraceae bacterium]
MEKKGLIARLPKRQDKRIGLITITAKGAELIAKTPELLHEQLSLKLKKLSEVDLQKLQSASDSITDFLNIENVADAPIITAVIDSSKVDIPKVEDLFFY